jgi:hypothetical protein
MRTSPRESSRDGFSATDRETIIKKAKDGYRLCVAGREHKCLLLWKMVDGVLHLIELGSYDDEKIRFINELGLSLEAPPVYIHPSLSALSQPKTVHDVEIGLFDDKMRRLLNELGMNLEAPPPSDIEPGLSATPQPKIVKELPTHPPKEQPDEKTLERLKLDLKYYGANGYVINPRKKKGTYHMVTHRRGESKGDKIDLGLYEMVEPMCKELDIDIADLRRLKAKGWSFRENSKGELTARGTGDDGKPHEPYMGMWEEPFITLCKKNGIKVKRYHYKRTE